MEKLKKKLMKKLKYKSKRQSYKGESMHDLMKDERGDARIIVIHPGLVLLLSCMSLPTCQKTIKPLSFRS